MGQESFLTISSFGVYDARGMGVKVAVVGGGSTYTPELVEGFVTRGDRLPVDELVLLDIDPERLSIVGALAERMMRRAGWSGNLTLTADRDEALEGADFVIVQLRVGGQAARFQDETIPLRFGSIGQETTGAGGFAKALRTVPVVLELAEETARRGAPGAWFVDFTNPTGLVTQALLDEGHRALGLCNVAIGFQRRFATLFGVGTGARAARARRAQPPDVGAQGAGGRRRPPARDPGHRDRRGRRRDGHARGPDPGDRRDPVATTCTTTTSRSASWSSQRTGKTRAEEVMEIEAGLIELYKDPTLDTKPKLLEERGGAFYSDAAAALVASLHAGTDDVQVVNVRNDGAIPNLPDDAVVEVSARVDRDGAHPLPVDPLPPEMLGLVEHAKAYELLAIEAAMSGDRGDALKALMTNPLVGDYDVAEPLLDALLDANRDHLPRFFAAS